MMRPIVIVQKVKVQSYRWECQDTEECGDLDTAHNRAQSYARARKHVADTGHEVEVCKVMAYIGRGDTLGYRP